MRNHSKKRGTCCTILWLTTTTSFYDGEALSIINSQKASPKRWRQRLGRHFTPHTATRFHSTALGSSSSSSTATTTPPLDCLDPDFFLQQVETSVRNALSQFPDHDTQNDSNIQAAQKEFLLTLDGPQRESFGVAQNLHQRLSGLRKNNDCPRCWMQRAHCICQDCPPISTSTSAPLLPQLDRIFVIMHHKEIAMKVDTAKLILGAFPDKCRLVVAGIGPEYQASMKELYEAMELKSSANDGDDNDDNKNCLVLFPDENAKSIQEILVQDYHGQLPNMSNDDDGSEVNEKMENYQPYDLIVLDGTWAQARKIHTKYIAPMEQGGPRRVQLSESAVETLQGANDQSGHQLRRHTVAWRQVGTYEATRLFLKDLEQALPRDDLLLSSSSELNLSAEPVWKQIAKYQSISNEAARREMGPPRE
ncbi:unnamed protein product [Cylindrotheca closterium]|uniref:tRNA-uridine aminocarboxypropyltransferase n=1 Tax=Cylindrotheca closterium TaxID=2856 RepID=A0AAD2GE25_9STRA|nr:unnamed protein product [Cylindrotheca closterium]